MYIILRLRPIQLNRPHGQVNKYNGGCTWMGFTLQLLLHYTFRARGVFFQILSFTWISHLYSSFPLCLLLRLRDVKSHNLYLQGRTN